MKKFLIFGVVAMFGVVVRADDLFKQRLQSFRDSKTAAQHKQEWTHYPENMLGIHSTKQERLTMSNGQERPKELEKPVLEIIETTENSPFKGQRQFISGVESGSGSKKTKTIISGPDDLLKWLEDADDETTHKVSVWKFDKGQRRYVKKIVTIKAKRKPKEETAEAKAGEQ